MRKLSALWPALAVVLAALSLSPAYAGDLRVGVGKASVTPGAAEFPYAPSDAPSLNTGPGELSFVGVHDDIYARALVMDDGARRVALVVLEVTAIPMADDLVKAVAREIGVPGSNVMLAATHTHSVPLFSYAGSNPSPREQREIDLLKQGAIEAVRQANAQLQPARIVFARGQAWINVNNGEQSGSHAGYDQLGPSAKTLDVMRFESPQGSPIALLVNYASHAEVMFRSVTRDNGYEVSGDLPGAVSRILEGSANAAPLVLFTGGAEADQLTLFKSLQPAGPLPAADEGAAGWALLDVQARRLAESVLSVVATMQPGTSQARIEAASRPRGLRREGLPHEAGAQVLGHQDADAEVDAEHVGVVPLGVGMEGVAEAVAAPGFPHQHTCPYAGLSVSARSTRRHAGQERQRAGGGVGDDRAVDAAEAAALSTYRECRGLPRRCIRAASRRRRCPSSRASRACRARGRRPRGRGGEDGVGEVVGVASRLLRKSNHAWLY
jgi:hypothetical protein